MNIAAMRVEASMPQHAGREAEYERKRRRARTSGTANGEKRALPFTALGTRSGARSDSICGQYWLTQPIFAPLSALPRVPA
jgi:hypothetical protein